MLPGVGFDGYTLSQFFLNGYAAVKSLLKIGLDIGKFVAADVRASGFRCPDLTTDYLQQEEGSIIKLVNLAMEHRHLVWHLV